MENQEISESDDRDSNSEEEMDYEPGLESHHSSSSSYSEGDDDDDGDNNDDEEEDRPDVDVDADAGSDYDDKAAVGFTPEQHKQRILNMVNKTIDFKFTLNYSLFPDLVPYFWASLNEYFQELLELFIISDGWRLTDFLKAAETRKLHSIFRCAYSAKGRVEARAKHFCIVFQILLDSAKFQWLAPWKTRNTFGLSVCIKRQVGGLFLAYYLLFKQPEPSLGVLSTEKQKMHVDSDDSRAIRFFLNDVDKLEDGGHGKELKKEVKLIFLKLHHQGLFEKTMLREDYCLDLSCLLLTGSKTDPRLNYFGLLKDVRDKLLYITYQGIGNTTFRDMLKVAQTLQDNNDSKRKKFRRAKQSSDDRKKSSSKSAHSSKGNSTKTTAAVTFQTKLRQRLDQQFRLFQKQYSTPLLEMENETTTHVLPETKLPTSESPVQSSSKTKTATDKTFKTTKTEANAFPPERKSEWTVEDVKALKDERDLAVIAFRIVEILRFVTPANPLTTARLINEMRVDQNAQDLMEKHASREKAYHEKRLSTPSRLLKLSQEGKHRCFKTTETKYWMDYLSDPKKNTKTLTPSQFLEKLRTHDVVATEPALIFKPSEHRDTTFLDGDAEFEFDDKKPDKVTALEEGPTLIPERMESSNVSQPSLTSITWTASNRKFGDMPDLSTFWEEEEAITSTSFGDEPPHLSPLSQEDPLQITGSDFNTNPAHPQDSDRLSSTFSESDASSRTPSPVKKKSWFILTTGSEPQTTLTNTKPSEVNPERIILSMPSLSNLTLSPTKTTPPSESATSTQRSQLEPQIIEPEKSTSNCGRPKKRPCTAPLRRGTPRNKSKSIK